MPINRIMRYKIETICANCRVNYALQISEYTQKLCAYSFKISAFFNFKRNFSFFLVGFKCLFASSKTYTYQKTLFFSLFVSFLFLLLLNIVV